uniref:Glutaredoxin-like protein n=1 Tax=Elaeis guineensis var. tenera TaxID=51953 RepID=A0A6I9SHV0_ELAGV|nr:uncharacterized protein LOC105060928 isoform X2 [Elaeis guineensis]
MITALTCDPGTPYNNNAPSIHIREPNPVSWLIRDPVSTCRCNRTAAHTAQGGLDRTLLRQMAAVVFSSAIVAVRFSPRSLRPLAAALSGRGGGEQRRLVLYTKPGCCLCDGLKEKLDAAIYLDGPSSIHLQVRDITANPEWEKLYQYEIPVLAKIRPDGTEIDSSSVNTDAPDDIFLHI